MIRTLVPFSILDCLLFFLPGYGQQADFVLYNAKVYTMNSTFETREAMAVKGGRILELGNSASLLSKYKDAKKIDAGGKAVYPGFIDAHAHFLGYARSLISVDFGGTQSWEECLERIRNFIREKSLAPGSWIVGRGWDQNDWPVKEFPDRRKLDSLFPDTQSFWKEWMVTPQS